MAIMILSACMQFHFKICNNNVLVIHCIQNIAGKKSLVMYLVKISFWEWQNKGYERGNTFQSFRNGSISGFIAVSVGGFPLQKLTQNETYKLSDAHKHIDLNLNTTIPLESYGDCYTQYSLQQNKNKLFYSTTQEGTTERLALKIG